MIAAAPDAAATTADAPAPRAEPPAGTARLRPLAILLPIGVLTGAFLLGQLVSLIGSAQHDRIPMSVQVQALQLGCSNAMFAMGIVLIYRSNRIINFAHAGFGGVAAIAFLLLHRRYGLPWGLAFSGGVAAAAVTGALVELALIRRFTRASRLVLTVVTIGVAQLLQSLAFPALALTDTDPQIIFDVRDPSPFTRFRFNWFPVVFTGDHLLLAAVTLLAMAGLAAFFKVSSVGIAVRAAAENDDRANLLGVNTRTLATVVWMLAAVLSGLSAVMDVPISGLESAASVGVGSAVLLRALAAAVFARFESLPLVVVAAFAINVFEQSVFFVYGRTDIVDAFLFLIILGGLLLQKDKLARSQGADSGSWASAEEIRPVPPELAHLSSVRRAARYLFAGGALVVLGYPFVASPSQTNLGALFAIYGIVAVSLVVLIGWSGQISLGQWGLAGVGAVVGGALAAHVWFPVAILGGGVAGACAAVLLGLPALRIRGLFLAVTTLAFSAVVANVLLSERYFGWLLPNAVSRPKLAFVDFEDERAFYYLCLGFLVLTVLAGAGLRNSRTGRVLIAMRDNERTAQSYGINLVRTRLATFAISGFFASVAGSLFAFHQRSVAADTFQPSESIQMFLMAVIGGLGSVTAVLLGPVYLGLTSTFLADYRLLASAGGVLVVLLVVPGGFGALAYGLRDAYLRRVAIRNKIFVPSLLADYAADGSMSRVPIAPKVDADGEAADVPVHYRKRSRIGVTGASQSTRAWMLR